MQPSSSDQSISPSPLYGLCRRVFQRLPRPAVIGVIHLLPLPGSPSPSPGLERVSERALSDAKTLASGGVDGIIIENYGDAPFSAGQADPFTVASMTTLAYRIRSEHPNLKLGLNVLRNDGLSALGIAAATCADFIRVNVFIGTTATDQGIIQGESRALHLERNRIRSSVKFAVDVNVKHGTPLQDQPTEEAADDVFHRAKADAVIVTGRGTGHKTSIDELKRVRATLPNAPLWVGSGVQPNQISHLVGVADALIVGSWFRGGDLTAPVQATRVRSLMTELGGR